MDPYVPALALAESVRRRQVSPVELVRFYLDRIDSLDGGLNAFCHRDDERVLAWARRAEQQVMSEPVDELAPFTGVPITVKDLNRVEGWPTTYGSRGASTAPNAETDLVVQRLIDGGFIPLGMTNAPEFGTISYTESDAHGITRNPWDPDRTPGGSSGGSAVAVAAGMAPIGHANDGGGSIRIPASCCGLVGLKASRNRVSNGVDDLEGYSINGVVSRTVADTAAALDLIGRPDPLAWHNAPPETAPFSELARREPPRLRILVLDEPLVPMPIDRACVEATRRTTEALAALGHDIVEGTLDRPDVDAFVEAFGVVWDANSADTPLADWDAIEPLNRAVRAAARARDSIVYVEAVRATERLSRRVLANFGRDFDVLLSPTMAVQPPRCESWKEGMELDPMMGLLNCFPMGVFTSVFNVTGSPAISLPVHVSEEGLPVGVQLVGGPWQDALLLQVASQLEPIFGWADRHPPLG